jgi:hypothetical protein
VIFIPEHVYIDARRWTTLGLLFVLIGSDSYFSNRENVALQLDSYDGKAVIPVGLMAVRQ